MERLGRYNFKVSFFSLHRQGFVRVAACTPRVHVGDPSSNADETLAAMRQGDARNADLMVFPELGISAYAIDDLLLQDALLDGGRGGDRTSSSRPPATCVPCVHRRAPLRPQPAPLQLRRGDRSRKDPGRGAQVVPAQLPRVLREPLVRASGRASPRPADRDQRRGGTLRHRPATSPPRTVPDFTFHAEICEDFWVATPPSAMGALAGALILCNLSASNVLIGKADERAHLCSSQSARCLAAYVFAAAGFGEYIDGISHGTGKRRSTSWGRCLPRPIASPPRDRWQSPTSTWSDCGWNACERHVQRCGRSRGSSRAPLPPHPLRASHVVRRCRTRAQGRPLPLRAG